MRQETRSKLDRAQRRHRLRVALALGGGLLLFAAIGAISLDPWRPGDIQTAEVVGYQGVVAKGITPSPCGFTRAIVRLEDGSEGLLDHPLPCDLRIGERILVQEQTTPILRKRRFMFAGRRE